MLRYTFLLVALFCWTTSFGQKVEAVYLNSKDSTVNMYVAVEPDKTSIKAFMFLIPGAFQTPQYVLQQTDLPLYAAKRGVLTIIPTFATGISSFGVDDLTQQSLKEMLNVVASKYNLQGKNFFIGGLSIGGSAAVKYAELALQDNYAVKPTAVFGIDPPLDFERYYNSAKRIMQLSVHVKPNEEIPYMIDRIEKEMHGTPETAILNFYKISPYSISDSTQKAVRTLVDTPILFISEPDIDWWLSERGYDYTNINTIDQAAMINELQRLGNRKAILITTHNKGYRKPQNIRHPHSWSIADPEQLVNWLLAQS